MLLFLPPCSQLPMKEVRWWQWPHVPICLPSPPARMRFTPSPEEKEPYYPSASLQRVLHPLSTWAFAVSWPSREMAAASISRGMLLAAPGPQAADNPSAMKQLTVLPPPWLEFGSLTDTPQGPTHHLLFRISLEV